MSIFNTAARRSVGLESRIEDTSIIYNSDPFSVILNGKYRDHHYEIMLGEFTRNKCCKSLNSPVIIIDINSIMSLYFIGDIVRLKDKNGEEKILTRIQSSDIRPISLNYYYNKPGDYIKGYQEDGHKYTLDEIEQDCHAFIDDICENTNKVIESFNFSKS